MWDRRTTRWRHFFPSTAGSWVELLSSGLATASVSSCWHTPGPYYSVLFPLPLWSVWQGPWGQLCSLLLQGCWGSISILWCAQQGPFPWWAILPVYGLSGIRILLSSRSFSSINHVCRRPHMMCALRSSHCSGSAVPWIFLFSPYWTAKLDRFVYVTLIT